MGIYGVFLIVPRGCQPPDPLSLCWGPAMWPVTVNIVLTFSISLLPLCWLWGIWVNHQGSRDGEPVQSRPTLQKYLHVQRPVLLFAVWSRSLFCVLLMFHPGRNILEWGCPGTSGLAFTQKRFLACLIKFCLQSSRWQTDFWGGRCFDYVSRVWAVVTDSGVDVLLFLRLLASSV